MWILLEMIMDTEPSRILSVSVAISAPITCLVSILSLVVTPELINRLPQKLHKQVCTVPSSHLLVEFCYKPISKTVAVVQKPGCHIIALVPAITLPRLHPVAWGQVSPQPHKICNSLYQSPGVSLFPYHCHTCAISW